MSSTKKLTYTISGSEIPGEKPAYILALERELKTINKQIWDKKEKYKNA